MNYEQKYNAALERAMRELQICGSQNCDAARQIYRLFPELKESKKESKEERIRRVIIEFLQAQNVLYDRINTEFTMKEAIAWLEKQGEQKKVSIWKHWEHGIAGNGEGKLVYLIKMGNTYSLSSGLSFECDYIKLADLDNLMIEKQGENKLD